MFSRSGFNPTAGCRCRHGSLLHIVCPCLSLAVGQVNWGGGGGEGEGKERGGSGGLHCFEVSHSEAT